MISKTSREGIESILLITLMVPQYLNLPDKPVCVLRHLLAVSKIDSLNLIFSVCDPILFLLGFINLFSSKIKFFALNFLIITNATPNLGCFIIQFF